MTTAVFGVTFSSYFANNRCFRREAIEAKDRELNTSSDVVEWIWDIGLKNDRVIDDNELQEVADFGRRFSSTVEELKAKNQSIEDLKVSDDQVKMLGRFDLNEDGKLNEAELSKAEEFGSGIVSTVEKLKLRNQLTDPQK